MEALLQGGSAALVLLGLAVLLLGLATLWRAVASSRVQQHELAYERELHQHAAQQRRERAEHEQRWLDLAYSLVPTAAAVAGHWLGSRSGRLGLGSRGSGGCGCIRRPMPVPGPLDEDDSHVELDLDSLLEALGQTDLGAWISSKARATSPDPVPADDDDVPTFVDMPIVGPPTSERPS